MPLLGMMIDTFTRFLNLSNNCGSYLRSLCPLISNSCIIEQDESVSRIWDVIVPSRVQAKLRRLIQLCRPSRTSERNELEKNLGESRISKRSILRENKGNCISSRRLRTKDARLGQRERVENREMTLFFPSFIHEDIAISLYSSGEANLWNVRFTMHAEAR